LDAAAAEKSSAGGAVERRHDRSAVVLQRLLCRAIQRH
jgi:hypothetical protein